MLDCSMQKHREHSEAVVDSPISAVPLCSHPDLMPECPASCAQLLGSRPRSAIRRSRPTDEDVRLFQLAGGGGNAGNIVGLSPAARASLLEKRQRAVAAIQHATEQHSQRLSSAPIAGARPGSNVRKSLGTVELNAPRCVGVPPRDRVGRLSRSSPSRVSLGTKTDIWLEETLTEESDATTSVGGDDPFVDRPLSARVRPCRYAHAEIGACSRGASARLSDADADGHVLQFTPPKSVVFSPMRTPPSTCKRGSNAAPPTLDVMAEAVVHQFAMGCWKALCRSVIPADCCGVSSPANAKATSRRRSRFRRSVGELIVSRTLQEASPSVDGYENVGEDTCSDDEDGVLNHFFRGDHVEGVKLSSTPLYGSVAGEHWRIAQPSNSWNDDEGEVASPLLSNRDETVNRLTRQRSEIRKNLSIRKPRNEIDAVAPWAEAERLFLSAQRAGALAAEDTLGSRDGSPFTVPVEPPPCVPWAADQVLHDRLENLLSSMPADGELVEALACEMANTVSRSSQDEACALSDLDQDDEEKAPLPPMFLPRRALFFAADDEKASISRRCSRVGGA